MVNGSDVVLSLQIGTTTNHRAILYGTADNFQMTSKDEDITSKQSGRFEEAMIVSHGASFDVSFIYESATSTTYYDPKALMDLELAGLPITFRFGKTTSLGVTGTAIITGSSIDAPANGKVSGKVSLKTTGTFATTASLVL